MPPITLVIGPDGELWHDCAEARCESSWDGYDLRTGRPVDGRSDSQHRHTPEEKGRVRILEAREG